MTTSQATFESLVKDMGEIYALAEIGSVLHWDQETMMPERGVSTRAAQLAELAGVLHAKRTSPELVDKVKSVDSAELDPTQKAAMREICRDVDKAQKVPASLLKEIAKEASLGHQTWAKARKEQNFSLFHPVLERMIGLKKEYAKCLGYKNSPYEALLDEFEPGAELNDVASLLGDLEAPLRDLAERIKSKNQPKVSLQGDYAADAQLKLAKVVSEQLGYAFTAGRLDLAVHPFTSGGTPGDVRITTRVNPQDFQDCLYSTIHEVGHALYEQGIDQSLTFSPLGYAVSLGVHESQSRLWENQVARGPFFSQWIYSRCNEVLGLGEMAYDAFYQAINEVGGSFIRTESDEVTYNLHILLRFELERAIFEEKLDPADLETAWNDRSEELLGFRPPSVDVGVLQDVHWSGGHFGYFPTYTLGNVFAAELYQCAEKDVDDLSAKLVNGDVCELLGWLRENVHQHGRLYRAPELLQRICGHKPSAEPLLDYLEDKFSKIYGL